MCFFFYIGADPYDDRVAFFVIFTPSLLVLCWWCEKHFDRVRSTRSRDDL